MKSRKWGNVTLAAVQNRVRLGSNSIAGNQDTAFLKLIALLCMFVDHLGATLFAGVIEMRVIGRMAFPLYAWCLVIGSVKTRNPWKYGMRLLLLALISQPLYMMALNHTWSDFNILYTLLIAMIAIQGIRAHMLGSQFWLPVLCYILLGYIDVDYGWKGLTFILLLYMSRESKSGLIATYLAYALFWGASSSAVTSLFEHPLTFLQWKGIGAMLGSFFRLQGMIWLSLPLIASCTHTGLKLPKWLGYGLYPLHLVVLIILKLASGVSFATLLRGF